MLPPTKKKKMNPLLLKVIFISVAIHLLAGLILGGITVIKYVIPDEAQFEEPPAVVEETPPPEVKVQIKPQQPKQQQAQRLSMRPVANIAVANVDVNLPDIRRGTDWQSEHRKQAQQHDLEHDMVFPFDATQDQHWRRKMPNTHAPFVNTVK